MEAKDRPRARIGQSWVGINDMESLSKAWHGLSCMYKFTITEKKGQYQIRHLATVLGWWRCNSRWNTVGNPSSVHQHWKISSGTERKNDISSSHIQRHTWLTTQACRRSWILSYQSKKISLGGRALAKKVIRECKECALYLARPPQVRMPPLHPNGMFESDVRFKPFTKIGIDMCGPFATKTGQVENKWYVLVIGCTVTRAISLQMLFNPSGASAMAGFERHSSLFGVPAQVYSDNGSNLVATRRLLDERNQVLSAIHKGCSVETIPDWNFQPPYHVWPYRKFGKDYQESFASSIWPTTFRKNLHRWRPNYGIGPDSRIYKPETLDARRWRWGQPGTMRFLAQW